MTGTRTRLGVTVTYRPEGAFLPVDRTFPWTTADDVTFLFSALNMRRSMNGVLDEETVRALEEAKESQMAYQAQEARAALVAGLGRWARWVPARVIDRVVKLVSRPYREYAALWPVEAGSLSAQVYGLHSRVSSMRGEPSWARRAPSYGPQVRCGDGCPEEIPLDRYLPLPPGWTREDDGEPKCPKHSRVDVMTSEVVAS
ncbi:hypothetical protein [Streptomyces sp. NPDC088752]|uniref:hypothetical protein n=1 Tax=Streptomyces sp. NPDC088752 TaxID=3154963 RepID=UPI0034314D68